jgi:hypothetical protein
MPRLLFVLFGFCTVVAGAQTPGSPWTSVLGRADGTFVTQTFRITTVPLGTGWAIETLSPSLGRPSSKARVELDADFHLVRSRTDYFDAELADWYRADFLLTEVQPADHNLAFQRVWKNQVQDAKNLVWEPDFVEFSTLPFVLERRVSQGLLGTFRFRTYSGDTPGTMEVTFQTTDRPLDAEKRYLYPRYLRDRFGTRPVILAALHAVGDFQGGYPYPFFYAFDRTSAAWVAAWGGNPRETSFQWKVTLGL